MREVEAICFLLSMLIMILLIFGIDAMFCFKCLVALIIVTICNMFYEKRKESKR